MLRILNIMDKIVFDIETKNVFADVGGEKNIDKLEASVVGVYSYNNDKYYCFEEYEFGELEEFFRGANLIIGFSSKRFDVPVLNKYLKLNLSAILHYDILEEIEKSFGRRVGLGILSEANLGIAKTGHGLEAVELFRSGEIEKLKNYCVQDVRITKEIFDLIRNQGYLWVPQRNTPQMTKVMLEYKELEQPPQGRLL